MGSKFTSMFAIQIEAMIKLKVSLGYSMKSYSALVDFDKYCVKEHPNEGRLTKELVSEWGTLKSTESANGLKRRLTTIREFGKYLNRIGVEAYVVPTEIIGKQEQYYPCIFTDSEIMAFFKAADSLPHETKDPMKEYTVPTLFRVTYSCGLRPQESYNIKRGDVNFNKNSILIRDAKRHRDRVIFITPDVADLCRRYDLVVDGVLPNREYFFHIPKDHKYKIHWIDSVFTECVNTAGISSTNGKKARVYNLRHNYATSIMHQWLDEGKDIMSLIPYLSAYMGHVSISSSAYYIHLLPERLLNNSGFDWNRFGDLIPEVNLEQ